MVTRDPGHESHRSAVAPLDALTRDCHPTHPLTSATPVVPFKLARYRWAQP